jgi:hypothetical protein
MHEKVTVEASSEDRFRVTVSEGESSTTHIVIVSNSDWDFLTDRKCSKEKLVIESFRFLLQREKKEEILPEFNIMLIAKYFPEYPIQIRKRL